VAAVLEALLAIPTIRSRLVAAAGMQLCSTAMDRLCALGFLHDLGKANAGFWSKQFPASLHRQQPRGQLERNKVRLSANGDIAVTMEQEG
jgi:CRISPR-associated endonuclease/helicase Cas3